MTAGVAPQPSVSDRRIERGRRSAELLLDSFFRPGHWASRLSYALGLQGRLETTTTIVEPRGRARRPRPRRIAFASDFHAGATTHPRLLAGACEALDRLEPDLLLLGGDFVSVRASYIDRLAPHLAAIRAPFGKLAVLGNHDLRANSSHVIAALEAAGVRMLTNDRVTLGAPFTDITVCGLDDPTRGTPRADRALDGVAGTRIVLMHSPDGLESIGDRPFDLALCGHTHGGQVALPWGTPLFGPGGRLNRLYCNGRFDVGCHGASVLLVSRGVGCSTIPIRAFAAPEVHLCLIA
jgi:predicted MPP superfamily phosphohydrolase